MIANTSFSCQSDPMFHWSAAESLVLSKTLGIFLHNQLLRRVWHQAFSPLRPTAKDNSKDPFDGTQEIYYPSIVFAPLAGSGTACGYCYCGAGASSNPCRSLDL